MKIDHIFFIGSTKVGKMFLKEIEAYLKSIHITAYYLNTERDVDAYHFYLKQGFYELSGNVMLAKSLKP